MENEKERIVYLEVDVTVLKSVTRKEAKELAKEFIFVESFSPLVRIDEVRVRFVEDHRINKGG